MTTTDPEHTTEGPYKWDKGILTGPSGAIAMKIGTENGRKRMGVPGSWSDDAMALAVNNAHAAALRSLATQPPLDLTQFDGITPGDWEWASSDCPTHAELYPGPYVGYSDSVLYHGAYWPMTPANKRAIAAVPKLIAEVRRLRAEVGRYRAAIQKAIDDDETGKWGPDITVKGDLIAALKEQP